ncbi:hypothetical protein L083_3118 [Actinoplanes sp. N902-109]|nr:hypothetical protein L083_3118 [Actinoplanes sp. N902-109]
MIAALAVAGGVLLTGPAALPVQAAPAPVAAAPVTPAVSLAGSWAVNVTFADGSTERGLFAFNKDGVLICTTTGSRQTGIGVWEPGAGNKFRFTFREQAFDDSGNFQFEIHINQQATLLSASSFTASGTGTAYDAGGNVLQSVTTSLSGTRYTYGS